MYEISSMAVTQKNRLLAQRLEQYRNLIKKFILHKKMKQAFVTVGFMLMLMTAYCSAGIVIVTWWFMLSNTSSLNFDKCKILTVLADFGS